jgi:hypothetical protein
LARQLVFASSPGARRRAVSVSGAAIPRGLARRRTDRLPWCYSVKSNA